jgi:hypothetical protein
MAVTLFDGVSLSLEVSDSSFIARVEKDGAIVSETVARTARIAINLAVRKIEAMAVEALNDRCDA